LGNEGAPSRHTLQVVLAVLGELDLGASHERGTELDTRATEGHTAVLVRPVRTYSNPRT